jgi:cellulose synthase/poly-beta-1,6-N-acetylglucosamine synthase-like glycosyltransferase
LDYSNYEIILLPDKPISDMNGVKIFATGSVTPGKKRNVGVKHAKGEICAFIDSDAYPRNDWLRNAVRYFQNPEIAGIGGPGVTPSGASLLEEASGYVLSSFMVGGLSSRYKIEKAMESDDIHSCNFIARKSIVEKIGWNEKYWPGEDTIMCLEIKKLGKKLLEAPDVAVYHHRRSLFLPHLKQISQFGMHRGFFVKKFPETSFRLTYLFPSFLLLLFLLGSVMSYYFQNFRIVFFVVFLSYLVLAFIAAIGSKNIKLILPVWFGILLTHLIYGIYFLMGLSKKELRR